MLSECDSALVDIVSLEDLGLVDIIDDVRNHITYVSTERLLFANRTQKNVSDFCAHYHVV